MDELLKMAAELDEQGLWSEADKIDELIQKMAAVPPDYAGQVRAQAHGQQLNNLTSQLWQTVNNIVRTFDIDKIQAVEKIIMSAMSSVRTLAAQASDDSGVLIKEAYAKRFDVDNAKKEIKKRTQEQIDQDTGYKWAGRAIAAYELFLETKDLEWFLRGADFAHEACEHSAMVCDDGKTLASVVRAINQAKKKLPKKLQVMDF